MLFKRVDVLPYILTMVAPFSYVHMLLLSSSLTTHWKLLQRHSGLSERTFEDFRAKTEVTISMSALNSEIHSVNQRSTADVQTES